MSAVGQLRSRTQIGKEKRREEKRRITEGAQILKQREMAGDSSGYVVK
jgi:hypothetical protein